jgi:predicted transcriptional regulator
VVTQLFICYADVTLGLIQRLRHKLMANDYELVASIRRSTIKKKLLELLTEPKTATDLKKTLNVHRESISRALLSLEKQGLVECMTPTQPNYRYYKTTKIATNLLNKFK